MQLVFLGTGGGRNVMALQWRATGGFLINAKSRIWVDPGPGSLVRCLQHKEKPNVDVLCVSHYHTDHSTDMPAVIEAMSEHTHKKQGVLIASKKIIEGDDEDIPILTNFHRSLLEKVYSVGPGEMIKLPDLTIKTTPTMHAEKSGVGFIFCDLDLSYTGDTGFFDELIKAHKGVSRIIINLISNFREPHETIMTVGGAIEFLNGVKPKEATLTHFGMRVLREGPEKIAAEIEKETGVKIIAARDGMKIDFGQQRL